MSRELKRSLVWVALAALPAGAEERVPALVGFVVEASSGLGAADLARAGDVAAGVVQGLPYGAEGFVIAFAEAPRLVQSATSDPEAIRAAVADLQPGGSAAGLRAALADAGRRLQRADADRVSLVVVARSGTPGSRASGDLVAPGIPVFAVVAGDAGALALRELAAGSGGRLVKLRDASGFELAAQIEDAPQGARHAVTPVVPAGEAAKPPERGVAPFETRTLVAVAIVVGGLGVAAVAPLLWLLRRRQRATGAAPPAPTRLLPRPDVGIVAKTRLLQRPASLRPLGGPASSAAAVLSDRAVSSLGRAPGNDVVLDDDTVSGEHCRFVPDAEGFTLHDLDSSNGTWVNEQRLAGSRRLANGDVVRVGRCRFRFEQ